MEDQNYSARPLQLFVRLLSGETLSLQFPSPSVLAASVKQRIYETTKIPVNLQRLICGHQLKDSTVLSHSNTTLNLSLRLLGGKGGFGSLLRGAATKAGQKKTSNFEACRDMSGRRLRHVNAERRLEEWKAEEEGRRMERIAEEFIKKKAKTGRKGVGDGEAEKYVEKYREESAKCVAVVEESVKEACRNAKRKAVPGGLDAKRLKIWMGKRKIDGNDSDDMDDSSSEDDDDEAEKSVVLTNGNHSDSNKGTEGSSGSVTGGGPCESGSEEEKETVTQLRMEPGGVDAANVDNGVVEPEVDEEKVARSTNVLCIEADVVTVSEAIQPETQEQNGPQTEGKEEVGGQSGHVSSENGVIESQRIDAEVSGSFDSKLEAVVASTRVAESDKPLNFDEFDSPEQLEVLGMERLKSELQARGLKCGGTLQERAARLFLLKSTPLEKLPKKLLAKK